MINFQAVIIVCHDFLVSGFDNSFTHGPYSIQTIPPLEVYEPRCSVFDPPAIYKSCPPSYLPGWYCYEAVNGEQLNLSYSVKVKDNCDKVSYQLDYSFVTFLFSDVRTQRFHSL